MHTLVRWFCLGVPAEPGGEQAIPPVILDDLGQAGLVHRADNQWCPAAGLLPFEQFWIASDLRSVVRCLSRDDAVLGPNPVTALLWCFAVREPGKSVLDLCTGGGTVALCLAESGARVTASDLNPRALAFARFNAALNDVQSVEFLEGDLFAPVAGRRFDLIVANPPFFITPVAEALSTDNAEELDGFCRELVRRAPEHLAEGGLLQMVCEWVEIAGQSWQERIAGWVDGLECDAWLMRGYTEPADRYAQVRLDQKDRSPAGQEECFGRWMAHYRERGVSAIHGGLLTLRKRTAARNWIWFDEQRAWPGEPFGCTISRRLAARDLLESDSGGRQLLASRLRLVEGVRRNQHYRQVEGRWHPSSIQIGLPATGRLMGVEPLVSEFIDSLDGSKTLAASIEALAAQAGVPLEQAEKECLPVVRLLLERGFLE
jgi:SAM-dependent methyltransferase